MTGQRDNWSVTIASEARVPQGLVCVMCIGPRSHIRHCAERGQFNGQHKVAKGSTNGGGNLAGEEANRGPTEHMKNKEYLRQLRVPHGELVAMQEWV